MKFNFNDFQIKNYLFKLIIENSYIHSKNIFEI